MPDEYEVYEESWTGRIALAAIVALALVAGAFFAGRAIAGGGPATLAEAVEQAQAGELPCGETAGRGETPPGDAPAPDGTTAPEPAGGAANRSPGFPTRALCGEAGQPPEGRGGFGQTGEVTAVSAGSLTLSGPMGETTVKLDGSTTISTSKTAKLADIEAGDTVLVSRGGGETATSVTVLPPAR